MCETIMQRVAKFAKKKKLAYNETNEPKVMGLRWYFLHLQGHKIPLGSRDFSDKFRGRQPKKFENPCIKPSYHNTKETETGHEVG
jgi:hypothetical protein